MASRRHFLTNCKRFTELHNSSRRQKLGRGGGIAKRIARWHSNPMMTLAEIEQAVGELPPAKQTELLYFLVQRLDDANLPLPQPRAFSATQLEQWMDQDEEDMRRFQTEA